MAGKLLKPPGVERVFPSKVQAVGYAQNALAAEMRAFIRSNEDARLRSPPAEKSSRRRSNFRCVAIWSALVWLRPLVGSVTNPNKERVVPLMITNST